MTENHNGIFHVHSSRGVEKVARDTCTCLFFSSMRLPCRHIFATRQATGESMYDKSLCDIRWTNDFFKKNQRIFSKSFTIDEEPVTIQVIRKKHKILNKAQKFRESSTITIKLAQLASDVGSAEYSRQMEVLKSLVWHWENGNEVSIRELSKGKVVAMSFYISNAIPSAIIGHLLTKKTQDIQRYFPSGVLLKKCSTSMKQIYRRTHIPKIISTKLQCNFIEITLRHGVLL